MNVAGYIFAGLAAAVHVYIFVLESILWTAPKTRATFGVKSRKRRSPRSRSPSTRAFTTFSWRSCRRSAS